MRVSKPFIFYVIFTVVSMFYLISCGRTYYDANIGRIVFETEGGGNIKFQIDPDGDDYVVTVTEYDFSVVDYRLLLDDAEDDVYALVQSIFDKTIDIYDEVFTPHGATGTWTSATLTYETGETVVIKNVSPGNTLEPLYIFVRAEISALD